MRSLRILLALLIVGALALLGLIYSGLYPIGADVPHARITSLLLETLRERSIEEASAHIAVPPLDDPAMISAGGAEYDEMCVACHLKPGMANSELRQGLYPQPPNLTKAHRDGEDETSEAAEHFWVIKHGIKASAMPAWGLTHDDAVIWSMVAFLKKLPGLSPEQYAALTSGESSHDAHHEHEHQDGGNGDAGTRDTMAGTEPAAVVDAFQKALTAGETDATLTLLDPEVTVFESGGVERSREDYARHHLGADAEFLGKASIERVSRIGQVSGDVAWVGSESRISAMDGSLPIELSSTETMILRKGDAGWRIVHVHWSSAKRADEKAGD